jgi:hypothetical protein
MFDFVLKGNREGNSEGGNTWVHITSILVDLYPQLRLANIARCIDLSRKNSSMLPLVCASHRDSPCDSPSSQIILQSTALA